MKNGKQREGEKETKKKTASTHLFPFLPLSFSFFRPQITVERRGQRLLFVQMEPLFMVSFLMVGGLVVVVVVIVNVVVVWCRFLLTTKNIRK